MKMETETGKLVEKQNQLCGTLETKQIDCEHVDSGREPINQNGKHMILHP
jgi:hypothetical protein